MLASIISSKRRWSEMLAFSNDYYGIIFRATQSVELFCAYERDSKIILRIEEILFHEKLGICPLGAKEIMEKFGLKPGKELGDLKRKAIDLAHENPYITKDELLEHLILIVNNQEVWYKGINIHGNILATVHQKANGNNVIEIKTRHIVSKTLINSVKLWHYRAEFE